MTRLPTPGSDNGTWGTILNDFLSTAHNPDGSLKAGSVDDAAVVSISENKVTNLSTDLASKLDKATLTTKGDVYVASGAASPVRVGVGSDGQVLTADSTQAAGVSWTTLQTASPLLPSLSSGTVFGRPTVVTHFQASHGYSAANNNSGASNLNDSSDFIFGSQAAKVVTNGDGAFVTLKTTGGPTFNTIGKGIRIWLKVANPDAITSLALYCGSSNFSNRWSWDVLQSPYFAGQYLTPAGQWTCLSFSFADAFAVGSPVRSGVTDWQLAINDANQAATVHFGGIDLYPDTPSRFPNGVVTLCFDDGYIGQYNLARPLLNQYSYTATLFPIVDLIGSSGSYLSVAQLQSLQNMFSWEIAPHAFTNATHSNFGSMSTAAIQADLVSNLNWMAQNGLRYSGSYAYPLGIFSGGQDAAVAPYVKVARTIQSTLNSETLPVGNQLRLRATSGVGGAGGFGVSNLTQSGGVLDECLAEKSWVILTIHNVVSGTASSVNEISQSDLSTLISAINTRGIAVATMSEVIGSGALL